MNIGIDLISQIYDIFSHLGNVRILTDFAALLAQNS